MRMHFYSWELSIAENAKLGAMLLDKMRKRWPAAFGTAKPLKLGIRDDLIAARVSPQDAEVFLSHYVQTPEYLQAQAQYGAQRVDLTGQPCGPVSDENATYAAKQLLEQQHQKLLRSLTGNGRGRRRPIADAQHPSPAPQRNGLPRPLQRAGGASKMATSQE